MAYLLALIVDDELEIREGLRSGFPWSDYGIESVLTADDGDTALELALARRPDLIVTDIRMKRMSGLELIGALAREQPDGWKAIVISGYDDFDMVRQAMKLGAMDYILKPINTAELGEVLGRGISRLEQERTDRKNRQLLNDQVDSALPKIRGELLREILEHDYDPYRETRLLHRLRTLQADWIACGPSVVLLLEADDLKAVENREGLRREKELILFGIGNVVKQTLEEDYPEPFILYEDSKQRWVAVLRTAKGEGTERIEELGNLCIERIRDFVKVNASAALCTVPGTMSELHARYAEAEEILEQKAVYGGQRLLTSRGWELETELDNPPITNPDEVLDLIRYGSEADIRAAMNRFYELVQSWSLGQIKDIQQHIFEWLLGIFKKAAQLGWSEQGWQRNPMILWDRLERYDTLESLRGQAELCLLEMARDFAELAASPGQIIQEAERYILQHYADNLTLQSVAAEVHVTPVWLSKLFKKEKHQTFLEYLTEVRMNNAKKMLGEVKYKIYQISSLVGYKDPVHFTKLFKKQAGCTPKEFRKLQGIADE
ncbi:response regulator [Paenibacillus sp. MMS20-IR301]|uniref:response regulator n=1 Tax=Paenibacillus sp. MMS20-IR301 TaxID=2895946 RepID=UPI0028E24F8F|nr:response regulator [Paenibacillus sp. MMS20-IR301]WNS43348.1 response regulator [Paenibacillus sp. MMS20-IR301]